MYTTASTHTFFRIFLFAWLVAGGLGSAWSQDEVAPTTEEAAQTTDEANPASAQPNMADLSKQLSETTKTLEANIESFAQRIEESRNSVDSGRKLLDDMEVAIKTINERLEENSDIWTQLDVLLADWEIKRQDALDRAETTPAFKEIAAEWASKLNMARETRNSILENRAESASLLDAMTERRDVIFANYELGKAQAVQDAMNESNNNFGKLIEGMKKIVSQAEQAAGPQVAQ